MIINDGSIDKLRKYLMERYGLKLSDEEISALLNWFKSSEISITEDNVEVMLNDYIKRKYTNKTIKMLEDDSSNLEYLLSLLKKNSGK